MLPVRKTKVQDEKEKEKARRVALVMEVATTAVGVLT